MLSDVSLQVRIELGRTKMLVEDVLRLNPDSVVELDKAAGDPVDIYVNGRRIARGECRLVIALAFQQRDRLVHRQRVGQQPGLQQGGVAV